MRIRVASWRSVAPLMAGLGLAAAPTGAQEAGTWSAYGADAGGTRYSALAQIDGEIDVLFNCAGIPGAPWSNLETMLVNFVGLRHFTEGLIPQIKERYRGQVLVSSAAPTPINRPLARG